jgi:hypothetical protein
MKNIACVTPCSLEKNKLLPSVDTVNIEERPSESSFRFNASIIMNHISPSDYYCGLVVRVLGYRSGGLGSIPGTTRKRKVIGLERGSLSLVSTTEELVDRKVAAPV